MKHLKYIALFVISIAVLPLSAQSNVVTFGLRGGAFMLNPKSTMDLKTAMGPAGFFDFGYLFYAPVGSAEMGIRTGLSFGYTQAGLSGSFSHQYTNTDYEGADMLYTTTSAFSEKQHQLLGEVPLMLAIRAKGFTLNAGAKLQVNVWQKAGQTLKDPMIDAYYVDADIHIPNELVTGVVDESQLKFTGPYGAPRLGVAVGGEIGYEWRVGQKGVVGVQAFVDYSVWNNYQPSNGPVIQVAPITSASDPVAKVTVHEVTQSIVSSVNPLTFGVKLYAGLDILTKKGKARLEEQEPLIINHRDTVVQLDTFYVHRVDTITIMDTMVYVDTFYTHRADTAIVMNNLFFALNKTKVLSKSQSSLDNLYKFLSENPTVKIMITGHTDNVGSEVSNQILSEVRANSVRNELIKMGIDANRIKAEGVGESEPIDTNDTLEGRQNNRRVEFTILGMGMADVQSSK